jgi:hypothetical protein
LTLAAAAAAAAAGAGAAVAVAVGLYSTLAEAIHVRDVAILAVHGYNPQVAVTLADPEAYNRAEVVATRIQVGAGTKWLMYCLCCTAQGSTVPPGLLVVYLHCGVVCLHRV